MKRALAILLSASALVGCAGFGTAGQEGGTRTVGQVVDDATLTAQVKSAFIADAEINALKINVDTAQGVVSLKGEVKSMALRRKAESLATGVKGVKSVSNQLMITG